MDPDKRLELAARREAAHERFARRAHDAAFAAYVKMVPLLAALETAGESYRSYDYRVLRGPLNLWAHAPERSALQSDSYMVLPGDLDLHDETILRELSALLEPGEPLLVILPWEALVVEVDFETLARHLALIRRSAGGLDFAITAPGAKWLVEVSPRGVAIGCFPS